MNKLIALKLTLACFVVAICLLPTLLNFFGIYFTFAPLGPGEHSNTSLLPMTGVIYHSLMEWSAVIIAVFVTVACFIHHRVNRDISVLIIGLALLCAGIVDAFHTLVTLQIANPLVDDANFMPFTWALSRAFNSAILLLAAILVLLFSKEILDKSKENHSRNKRLFVFTTLFFLLITYGLIHLATKLEVLPQTLFPDSLIKRPYDALALGLFVACVAVYWLLYLKNRRILRFALFVSMIPALVSQLHMVFGSSHLFDNHFYIAHLLKVVSYGVIFVGILIDLGGGGKAQLQTTNVSARLQSILNSIVDAVINIDERGKILAFNSSAVAMFGYSEQEVLGQNIKLLMPSELANQHDGYLSRYKETGEQHIIRLSRELPAMRKDGEIFPMILSVSEVQTEEGKIFTGLIRDITATKLLEKERKHAYNASKDLAWRLDFALSGPQIGVWDYDINKKVVSWDKRMFHLYGSDIESGEEPKILWKKTLHPDDAERVQNSLFKSINLGLDFKEVFRVILPNKHVNYIESYAKVFYDSNGKISRVVGTNRDITDQHNLHELKQQALDMAEDSLRLKSEFLASMSHEIRTPMNGVLGMLGLLEQTSLDRRQEHYVQLASSSANSLLYLINDILDFSKIEAGKLELEELDFDLRLQLGEVVESLAIKAQEKNVEIILDVNAIKGSFFKGDPTRIRQIVSNLVNNAIKFTQQGEILVKAVIEEQKENQLVLKCTISDSGIGIDEIKLASLFDSFTQVDASTTRQYGGTGLGLAIVKQLCELMGGGITVASELGKGSTFEFTINILASDSTPIVMPTAEIKGTNILIVDDNETNLEVLEGQLNQWGANITKARSGAQALDIIVKHAYDHFDLAILDMQMPHMDGASLGKALKQSIFCQKTKLIMMTSMGAQGDAKYFADLGFSAYFPKPATTSDLFDAITVVLDDSEALERATPLVTRQHLQTMQRDNTTQQNNEKVSILLVEDNRINQVVVQGMLENSGCQVDVAVNGQEALKKLAAAQREHAYQVVLMDCQMPVMDGYQATRAIRDNTNDEIDNNIPIIAMTANAMKGDREKCLASGMDDYISKPVDSNLLLEKLCHWVKGFEIARTDTKTEESNINKYTDVEQQSQDQDVEVIWDDVGLLKRVRDNRALAKKLIEMFLEDAPDLLRSTLSAINKKEYQEATALTHKIKGSVRNLGGVRLGTISDQMEQTSKSENAEQMHELILEFEQAFADFVNALENSDILL